MPLYVENGRLLVKREPSTRVVFEGDLECPILGCEEQVDKSNLDAHLLFHAEAGEGGAPVDAEDGVYSVTSLADEEDER